MAKNCAANSKLGMDLMLEGAEAFNQGMADEGKIKVCEDIAEIITKWRN